MRRLTFAAAVCGTLVFAACNDQAPTEPTLPRPSQNFGSCRATPFPLAGANGIAQQIVNIYTGTSKAQSLLRAEVLLRAGQSNCYGIPAIPMPPGRPPLPSSTG